MLNNFPNQNFVFSGTDAAEYKKICTQPNVEATKNSILFDAWINEHSSHSYNSDGSVTISCNIVNLDVI